MYFHPLTRTSFESQHWCSFPAVNEGTYETFGSYHDGKLLKDHASACMI
jgi:hypothetical protein